MRPFTPAELEVMQVLWEHGELKPSEIQDRFPRAITNMTLRSSLRVLVEKGHVKREKKGRAYFYTAKTPRKTALRRMTRGLANVLTRGSSFALIAELIKSENMSEEHVRKLQRIARGEEVIPRTKKVRKSK